MPEKIRRPISVWIAQALLFTLGCACGIAFIMGLLAITELPPMLSEEIADLAWHSAWQGGLSILFLSAFWSMAKRRNYGRWLGAAGFLSCIHLLTVGFILPLT